MCSSYQRRLINPPPPPLCFFFLLPPPRPFFFLCVCGVFSSVGFVLFFVCCGVLNPCLWNVPLCVCVPVRHCLNPFVSFTFCLSFFDHSYLLTFFSNNCFLFQFSLSVFIYLFFMFFLSYLLLFDLTLSSPLSLSFYVLPPSSSFFLSAFFLYRLYPLQFLSPFPFFSLHLSLFLFLSYLLLSTLTDPTPFSLFFSLSVSFSLSLISLSVCLSLCLSLSLARAMSPNSTCVCVYVFQPRTLPTHFSYALPGSPRPPGLPLRNARGPGQRLVRSGGQVL